MIETKEWNISAKDPKSIASKVFSSWIQTGECTTSSASLISSCFQRQLSRCSRVNSVTSRCDLGCKFRLARNTWQFRVTASVSRQRIIGRCFFQTCLRRTAGSSSRWKRTLSRCNWSSCILTNNLARCACSSCPRQEVSCCLFRWKGGNTKWFRWSLSRTITSSANINSLIKTVTSTPLSGKYCKRMGNSSSNRIQRCMPCSALAIKRSPNQLEAKIRIKSKT